MDNRLTLVEKGLIPIYQNESNDKLVNARELHEFLGIGKKFTDWIKYRIEQYGFIEGLDFFTILGKSSGGRPTTEYILKMDTAKELAMVENNSRGRVVRRYFIEIEKKYRQQSIDVARLSPELQMFNNLFKAIAKTQLEQQYLQHEITEVRNEIATTKDTLKNVKDTLLFKDEDWRNKIGHMLNKVSQNSNMNYQQVRTESYKLLEERARCNLAVRLSNLKQRLLESGASKTQINKANRLDVIENDVRLKEIYTNIVKEMTIKYVA